MDEQEEGREMSESITQELRRAAEACPFPDLRAKYLRLADMRRARVCANCPLHVPVECVDDLNALDRETLARIDAEFVWCSNPDGPGLVRKTDEDCGAVDGDRWER